MGDGARVFVRGVGWSAWGVSSDRVVYDKDVGVSYWCGGVVWRDEAVFD